MQPSDRAVLVVNQAVRDLRYLFAGVYGFSWSENDSLQQFEISASWVKEFPPQLPGEEGTAMVQFQTKTFPYADAEGFTPGDISGAVFEALSKAEQEEGFGE